MIKKSTESIHICSALKKLVKFWKYLNLIIVPTYVHFCKEMLWIFLVLVWIMYFDLWHFGSMFWLLGELVLVLLWQRADQRFQRTNNDVELEGYNRRLREKYGDNLTLYLLIDKKNIIVSHHEWVITSFLLIADHKQYLHIYIDICVKTDHQDSHQEELYLCTVLKQSMGR